MSPCKVKQKSEQPDLSSGKIILMAAWKRMGREQGYRQSNRLGTHNDCSLKRELAAEQRVLAPPIRTGMWLEYRLTPWQVVVAMRLNRGQRDLSGRCVCVWLPRSVPGEEYLLHPALPSAAGCDG